MSDIRQWLKELGRGQYADAFAEIDIERELMRELTNVELKRLARETRGSNG